MGLEACLSNVVTLQYFSLVLLLLNTFKVSYSFRFLKKFLDPLLTDGKLPACSKWWVIWLFRL
jgi:hypothetical protein